MKTIAHLARLAGAGILAVGLFSVAANAQQLQVTVTNLMSGQTFTPIMLASHTPAVRIFTLGQPASVALAHLAEAGDNSEIEAALRANPNVLDVVDSGAALPPGQSVTLTVKAHGNFNHLTVAAMLIPTNDGFFALNDVSVASLIARTQGGPGAKELVFVSPAYDSGTKADDELCANIPGPSGVCAGTGFVPEITGPNFVFVHAGIHGIGDLKPSVFDWRNPVAQITVTRVP